MQKDVINIYIKLLIRYMYIKYDIDTKTIGGK